MTVERIVDLLNPKNQNLPKLELKSDFGKSDVTWVPVIEKKEAEVAKLFSFVKKNELNGKKGEKLQVIHNNQLYYFVGLGPEKGVDSRKMRRFYGTMYLESLSTKPKTVTLVVDAKWVKEATVGVHVAALNPKLLNPNFKKSPVPNVQLAGPTIKGTTIQKAHKNGLVLAEGKNLMRLLGALPPNILNQKTYAEVIVKLAKQWKVPVERVAKSKLKNYQLLNAVSQGSEHDSELLIFTLKPKKAKVKAATAVVGKGLCYDSGGLIGKQDHMKSMKEDMAGSASVLATVLNIAKGGYEVKQTTYLLLALAENMMGQNAMRADDLYTTGDGKQVEIAHTDAEGRLVMADAICYAKKNFKNIENVYTIATLTGSCLLALGDIYTGMVCNSDSVSKKASELGERTGEYVFRAPWNLDYDDNNSPYADVSNLSPNSREAGWIKAGLFLYRFVPDVKKDEKANFCHFDIAGSIDMDGKQRPWRQKGFSSGIGVGLLTGLLTE